MKLVILAIFAAIVMAACLPDVATELSEKEARALIEREVLNICEGRSTNYIGNVLDSVDRSQAITTRDWWIFQIPLAGSEDPKEALVFPSKIVSGPFIVELETRTCG
ncbi:MAG: hypothetical protein O2821_08105 [Chloroflexi bacterium]|nr:hypothetical protein [Chloroflexota bacterium]MDA1226488.1 hypothetical protein [Chloroflexota bacterium]